MSIGSKNLIAILTEALANMQPAVARGNPLVANLATVDDGQGAFILTCNINQAINANANHGFIRMDADNTGKTELRVSFNGVLFTDWFGLGEGETMDLDGMDVHTIQVRSTQAGDKVQIVAWNGSGQNIIE